MARRVAVSGRSPTWRRGIAAILGDAGYDAVECLALSDWKPGRDGVAVILDLTTVGAAEQLGSFVDDHPHIPVVAVLDDLDLAGYAAAIRTGARAAVAEGEPAEAFVAVLESALSGRAAVPYPLIQSMAARIPAAPDAGAWVTGQEIRWLQALAEGETVARLADDVGYSEREMFRMLRDLYLRVGARNRTEAIIWATRHGILDTASLPADGGASR